MTDRKPLIAIPADARMLGAHLFHAAAEKYLRAVTEVVQGVPVIIPAMAQWLSCDDVLDRVDGILLPGSPSNIEPHHYNGSPSAEGTLHDPARDALSLPLIQAALARGTPLFAICRGLQEMNVALGGSLHQRVHELPGMQDHREDPEQPLDIQYGPAHAVEIAPGGLLADLLDQPRILVNSLHWQGINRLAPGARAEAVADDGLVEAFAVPSAPGFNLAVQWHPEWNATANPVSTKLFETFGDACRARMRSGA